MSEFLDIFKGILIILLFVTAFIGAYIPKLFIGKKRMMSLTNCFAGGVILGAGLMHLLPDAVEDLEGYTSFPLAFLIAAASSLMLFSFEALAQLVVAVHFSSEDAAALQAIVATVIIFLALSLHSIFEGIAIGIEGRADFGLAIAIVSHKAMDGSALGCSIIKSHVSQTKRMVTILIYCTMTPLGLAIGWILSKEANHLVEGILSAIAAGMFFNVAINHMLGEELSKSSSSEDGAHTHDHLDHFMKADDDDDDDVRYEHSTSLSQAAAKNEIKITADDEAALLMSSPKPGHRPLSQHNHDHSSSSSGGNAHVVRNSGDGASRLTDPLLHLNVDHDDKHNHDHSFDHSGSHHSTNHSTSGNRHPSFNYDFSANRAQSIDKRKSRSSITGRSFTQSVALVAESKEFQTDFSLILAAWLGLGVMAVLALYV